MMKSICLYFNKYIAMQQPMIKNEIYKVMFIVNYNTFLPGFKTKAFT